MSLLILQLLRSPQILALSKYFCRSHISFHLPNHSAIDLLVHSLGHPTGKATHRRRMEMEKMVEAQDCGRRPGSPTDGATSRTIDQGKPTTDHAPSTSSSIPATINQTLEPKTQVKTDSFIASPGESRHRSSDNIGNDEASLEYRYSPLTEPGSIRLIRLIPDEDRNSPIWCELFEYPLQKQSEGTHLYEAISYVWGSEDNQQPVYIQSDGPKRRHLLVTANLHAALSHLRDRYFERRIWVDAICINQIDEKEKGLQVQSMAGIYAKAIRVIVWLGEARDNSDQALKDIISAAHQDTIAPINQRAGSTEPDQQPTEAILTLLRRPWFERIWVSKRYPII